MYHVVRHTFSPIFVPVWLLCILQYWLRSKWCINEQTKHSRTEGNEEIKFATEVWSILRTGVVPRRSYEISCICRATNMIILIVSMVISLLIDTYKYFTYSYVTEFLEITSTEDTLPLLKMFLAWEYSGTDSVWATFIDQLYLMVEKHFTKRTLTLCRATISLAEISRKDTVEVNRYKCIRELLKLDMLRKLSILSWVGGTIALILSYEDVMSMISTISFTLFGVSFTTFLAGFGRYYAYATKQKKILIKKLGKYDMTRYERKDFKEEQGFMRNVKEELETLFIFLDLYFMKIFIIL